MSVTTIRNHGVGEAAALGEMIRDGYEAQAKEYSPGTTEPHRHDYDVCLYVLEGEFRVTEAATQTVHVFAPGDKAFVARGTLHAEDHGPLKMVVGRRH